MSRPATYEIVLRGHPSVRLLRPLIDDFAIDAMADGTTRLLGIVGDPAHLHGILAHLTSVNLEIISIAPSSSLHIDTTSKGNTMNTTHMNTSHEQPTSSRPAEAAATTQMRAITQYRYGTAEVLTLETVGVPTPERDEVLIEVVASGIDRGTCHLMTGTPYLVRLVGYGLTKPKRNIPGSDVAGRVVAVGADVTRFVPGDEVFGIAKGSLAEFAVANEDNLVIKPANVSFEHAAASAVSGITALQALVDVGRAEPGQRVLIVGASGGVGSFAVQLAKALGTVVTAVASTRNIDFLHSLGADHVVDYTAQDFAEIDRHARHRRRRRRQPHHRRHRAPAPSDGALAVPESASDDVHQRCGPLPHRAARCPHRIRSRHSVGPSNVPTGRCASGHRPTRHGSGDRQDRHRRPRQRRRQCRMNRACRVERVPAMRCVVPGS